MDDIFYTVALEDNRNVILAESLSLILSSAKPAGIAFYSCRTAATISRLINLRIESKFVANYFDN